AVVWDHHLIIPDVDIHFIQMFLQGFQARIAEFRVIAIHNAIINMFRGLRANGMETYVKNIIY
ncbi:TPA: hypothetical protein ACXGAW_005655, partial [Klebsiella pneumoniae]